MSVTAEGAFPAMPRVPADLSDPDLFVRGWPADVFRTLRADAPVAWNDSARGNGFWVVSRHQDVWDVSLDQKTFSSARNGAIPRDWSTEEERESQSGMLINMDPPRHTKYRRLVNLGFSPKMVNRLEPHIRQLAAGIVDAVAARGQCDFVNDVAAELPLQVIVEMIGVPLEDRHRVFDWSNRMMAYDDPEYQEGPETGQMAAMQMFMYANELALERKERPRGDLVSVLMTAEVEGEKLAEHEFDQFFLLLAVAGNETTRNLISGGMLALLEHPEQRARLMADRGLLDSAVEEMLRWVAPVMQFRRTVQRDVQLHGIDLREGDLVSVWYGSANRDERVFRDAHRFDVGRRPNEHLAFGIGPHFCLGANLARLEIRIMFEELLRRLPDLQLAGPVERLRSNFINGIKRMPVEFTPERR
jgi:cholest-4-en-3-one 26-monooxygenase